MHLLGWNKTWEICFPAVFFRGSKLQSNEKSGHRHPSKGLIPRPFSCVFSEVIVFGKTHDRTKRVVMK